MVSDAKICILAFIQLLMRMLSSVFSSFIYEKKKKLSDMLRVLVYKYFLGKKS